MQRLINAAANGEALGVLSVRMKDPTGYGRIVRDRAGTVARIVEHKDANQKERALDEVNTGLMAASAKRMREWLAQLRNDNAQGEYYLTDIVVMAAKAGLKVNAILADSEDEVLGVNDKVQLAEVEGVYRKRRAMELMLQGVTLVDGRFAGGMFDWLTPFSFVTGCALVWGYTLLGATWLVIKTEGELLAWARRVGTVAAAIVLVMIVVVSLWVPALDLAAADRWGLRYPDIDWSRLMPLTPVPLLVALAAWRLLRGLRGGATYSPYLWSVALFFLGYAGLLIGIYPYLVPYSLDIHSAAAAPNAQALLLAGAVVLLPLILGYTAWVYWVFRGKVRADAGYH